MANDGVRRLLLEMDYACDKEGWFAPLHPAVDGVDAAQAAWVPPGGGSTIRQIVNHVLYWKRDVIHRVRGEAAADQDNNDATFGAPGDPGDAAGWHALVQDLRQAQVDLRAEVARRTDADLDAPGAHPLHATVAGMSLHDAYHAGQIIQLRKQQGSWPARRA